jgi:hypothetical protein
MDFTAKRKNGSGSKFGVWICESPSRRERVGHQEKARRVRGAKILLFTPHPPLRVTLSLRERDSP